MLLTFLDVGGRKLLDTSIPGSLELTEMLMVLVIFAGLPLVSLRGEHVVFDSLDAYLPQWLKNAQRVAIHGLCAVALLGLAWLMWQAGAQSAIDGETSAQLKIAKAPFIHLMAVSSFIAALVHAAKVFMPGQENNEVGL